jgi:predicted peptidase
METLALATLDRTLAEYATDEAHVVLTGLSMGGHGAWGIGARHPDRFCAIVPVCGWGDPATADALADTPIWAWHGDADPVVLVSGSRKMVEAVRAAGGDVRYTELPGVSHNSWDDAYGNAELIAWMLGTE